MKRQIRKSVFETNSSSTHAICVSKDQFDVSKIPVKKIFFEHGEFGWENDKFCDIDSKASYLYQAMWECTDDPEWRYSYKNLESKKRWIEEKSEIVKKQYLEPLENILNKYNIECDFDDHNFKDGFINGYVDHGCELKEFVDKCLTDEDYLLNYLFGDSFIVTGNDNEYCNVFDEFYDKDGKQKSKYENYDIFEKWN